VSQKSRPHLFSQQLWQQWINFHNFSLLNSETICGGRKWELKLPSPLKSVAALRRKMSNGQTIELYIHISKNNMLDVR